jgi:hypothetical protein
LPRTYVAVRNVSAQFCRDQVMQRHRLVSINLDMTHGDKHSVTIVLDTRTTPQEAPAPQLVDHELVIREARRRQHRRWLLVAALIGLPAAVFGVLLFSSTTAPRRTLPRATQRRTPKDIPLVKSHTPLLLDLFWSEPIGYGPGANVSVNLSDGVVHASPEAVSVFGLARQGYILGSANTVAVSMSYDLRHTLHTWTGQYGGNPVPATNSSDIWVSSGTGATELNEYERPVAPTVTIPAGSTVEGQADSNLAVIGPPPSQMLELWSPAQQRVLATFGAQEYSDAVATATQNNVVWSDRNVVHIDAADGQPGPVLTGPKGQVATSLAVSPDGSRVAIVFNPAPGTPDARTGGEVEIANMSSGSSAQVPGSAGAKDLLAWSPDGSRIFFPRLNGSDSSVSIATYRIGSQQASSFEVPGLRIPTDLSGATGSVVVVDAPQTA